jgi:geranylgeranyl pyrophosphate synthase
MEGEIRSRLMHRELVFLYDKFQACGVEKKEREIIDTLPGEVIAPLVHTLETHVTKEKPVMVLELGQAWNVETGKLNTLAAAVDLLWALSLIYDDIVDGDQFRAGKTTAWRRFGKEAAFKTASLGLGAVVSALSGSWGENTARLCQSSVEKGVASVKKQRDLRLDSSPEQIEANYEQRMDFHTMFPVATMGLGTLIENGKAAAGRQALKAVNMAGQIFNDLKDLLPGRLLGRAQYADLRGGIVNIPIAIIWQRLNQEQKQVIAATFGVNEVSEEASNLINQVLESGVEGELKGQIRRRYQESEMLFETALGEEGGEGIRNWIGYKNEQLERML